MTAVKVAGGITRPPSIIAGWFLPHPHSGAWKNFCQKGLFYPTLKNHKKEIPVGCTAMVDSWAMGSLPAHLRGMGPLSSFYRALGVASQNQVS